jgi:hypothetical protein
MSEIEVPERGTEDVLCHCVLIHTGQNEGDPDTLCNVKTSGPDDPFCKDCSDRHKDHIGVVTGYVKVTARMREKVQS